MDIRSARRLAWENKLAKGFNTTDVPLEFCLLSGEVAEAFDAWRKGRPDVAEELADTAIFLLGLAGMIASGSTSTGGGAGRNSGTTGTCRITAGSTSGTGTRDNEGMADLRTRGSFAESGDF